jgi:hypothetical protein
MSEPPARPRDCDIIFRHGQEFAVHVQISLPPNTLPTTDRDNGCDSPYRTLYTKRRINWATPQMDQVAVALT